MTGGSPAYLGATPIRFYDLHTTILPGYLTTYFLKHGWLLFQRFVRIELTDSVRPTAGWSSNELLTTPGQISLQDGSYGCPCALYWFCAIPSAITGFWSQPLGNSGHALIRSLSLSLSRPPCFFLPSFLPRYMQHSRIGFSRAEKAWVLKLV